MKFDIAKATADLRGLTVGGLLKRYAEVFGETARSRHREYLVRRIAWRLQADAEGGLSERARKRAAELAADSDIRTTPPKDGAVFEEPSNRARHDPRLPPVGAAIVRDYKGRALRVVILPDGFEYDGKHFRTLSAVANAITGSHINGFRFFGLKVAS